MATITPPPDSESTSTIAISGLVIVLAVIFTALRFYVRISKKAGLGWDDWLLLCSVITTIITAVLVLVASAVNSHGTWIAEATDPEYVFKDVDVLYVKLTFAASILYFTIAGSTKLSILLMYNRIFSVSQVFRYQLYVASFLVLGWWIGCTVATLTDCIPLKYTWVNGLDDPRYCFNFNVFWMVEGAVEVVIDIVILSLPTRTVLGLQLTRRNKIIVVMIFLLGGFVVVTGVIRTVLGYAPNGRREPLYGRVEVWTMVHTSLAIICACLPILMPLVTAISRWIGMSSQKYAYGWYAAGKSRVTRRNRRKRNRSDLGPMEASEQVDTELLSQTTSEGKPGSNSRGTSLPR